MASSRRLPLDCAQGAHNPKRQIGFSRGRPRWVCHDCGLAMNWRDVRAALAVKPSHYVQATYSGEQLTLDTSENERYDEPEVDTLGPTCARKGRMPT